MTVLRTLSLGCLLAVALACAAAAAPQGQPTITASPGQVKWFHDSSKLQPTQLAHQYVAAEKQEDKKEHRGQQQ